MEAFWRASVKHEALTRYDPALELGEVLRTTLTDIPGVAVTCPLDPELGSVLVTFSGAGKEPRQVVEALWQKHIAGRQVPDPAAVRLCTAFFNTEDEIHRVGEALAEIAKS